MSHESQPDLIPQIAHVLLMDVVGYSKLVVEEQIALLGRLNQVVRGTTQFLAAEREGSLRRLPTGDGMALIFFDSPESPVRCALQISAGVRAHGDIPLRMGIHSGAIKEVMDVNDHPNVAGAGIDLAQRVLDCGDAGHILLTHRVAEDLQPYQEWHDYLIDLGECEVKHGRKLHIFNLCKDGLGNPALPEKIHQQRTRRQRIAKRWRHASKIKKVALVLVILALLVAIGIGIEHLLGSPEKSIAVLPFANLSRDQDDAHYAADVHGEILSRLVPLGELKVTGPASVMDYIGATQRDWDKISRALGVGNLLEGSVQRDAQRIHITVQLIEARTRVVRWAGSFDSDLNHLFATVGEIVENVATQLKANLPPQVKTSLKAAPTNDREAYALYAKGKLLLALTFNARARDDVIAGTHLLEQAVALDPQFFLAYYQLARAHDQIYHFGYDHTPARVAMADAAVKAMQRLRPDAGETHLALGEHLYWALGDYETARQELQRARAALPNDPAPILLLAYIDRRQGRSEESLRGLNEALKIEPRDLNLLQQISLSYQHLRRFPEMTAALEAALEIAPDDAGTRMQRANVDLDWRADTKPLRTTINSIIEKDPAALSQVADIWIILALCERNGAEAERAVAAMTAEGCSVEGVPFPRSWCAGMAARVRGDTATAEKFFLQARADTEKLVGEQPDYGEALSVLAVIDAALGHKEEAIAEGNRAVELLPLSQDSIDGAILIENLALIYAWTGEADRALEQLRHASEIPSLVTYGQLRLHPNWDVLREDPRFQEIVDSLKPK